MFLKKHNTSLTTVCRTFVWLLSFFVWFLVWSGCKIDTRPFDVTGGAENGLMVFLYCLTYSDKFDVDGWSIVELSRDGAIKGAILAGKLCSSEFNSSIDNDSSISIVKSIKLFARLFWSINCRGSSNNIKMILNVKIYSIS